MLKYNLHTVLLYNVYEKEHLIFLLVKHLSLQSNYVDGG